MFLQEAIEDMELVAKLLDPSTTAADWQKSCEQFTEVSLYKYRRFRLGDHGWGLKVGFILHAQSAAQDLWTWIGGSGSNCYLVKCTLFACRHHTRTFDQKMLATWLSSQRKKGKQSSDC